MAVSPEDARRWVAQGESLIGKVLDSLGTDDSVYEQPSALPGWSIKHLTAHIAANADAVGNLVVWAKTGIETPMYASPQGRAEGIENGAKLSAAELKAWFARSAAELNAGWDSLTDEQWHAQVVTAQGRTVPVSETIWMRAREVMVHAIDFGDYITFEDLPHDFHLALIADICAKRSNGGNPALLVEPTDTDQRWQVTGDGEPVSVTGTLAQLTAYLAGRPHRVTTLAGEPAPVLPPWL